MDTATDFPLPNGEKLSDLYKKGPVVVYFYPEDFTAGCTREACAFRDSYEDFKSAGAEVIGVSEDDSTSHKKFAQRYRLPFILVSDEGGKLARSYGVKRALLGMAAGRETFVIDQQGKIRHHFVGLLQFSKHVEEALAIVKQLAR